MHSIFKRCFGHSNGRFNMVSLVVTLGLCMFWPPVATLPRHHFFSKWPAVGKEAFVSFQQCSKPLLVDDRSDSLLYPSLSNILGIIISPFNLWKCEASNHSVLFALNQNNYTNTRHCFGWHVDIVGEINKKSLCRREKIQETTIWVW